MSCKCEIFECWKERHPDGPGKHIFVKTVILYGLINIQMAMRSKSDLIRGVPRIDLIIESVLFFVKLNRRHYLFKSFWFLLQCYFECHVLKVEKNVFNV